MSEEPVQERIRRYLVRETNLVSEMEGMNEEQLRKLVERAVVQYCRDHEIALSGEERGEMIWGLITALVSLGPLHPLMQDDTISEIMINGADDIYIQRAGKIVKSDITFENNHKVNHTVQKMLESSGSNKRVDESSPYVDFMIGDGSRVNAILPPCALNGPTITIRKFSDSIGTVEDLLKLKMFDDKLATLLIAAMKAKFNVIFCGSTGAGKTTMMNVFSRHIPEHERIITIEDTPELRLLQEHVVSLASKPANIEGKGEITLSELFDNCLRMRPDRIIIGEIRGEELLAMIKAISAGFSGSLAVVHAETVEDCFRRMLTMMLESGIRLDTAELQRLIAKAIDVIVHAELFMDGCRRVTALSEVAYDEDRDKVVIRELFSYKQTGMDEAGRLEGHWEMNPESPGFMEKFAKRRVELPPGFFQG